MTRIEFLLIIVSCLILGKIQIDALKCYVCKDCDLSYNETHLTQCEGEDEAVLRCIVRTFELETNIVRKGIIYKPSFFLPILEARHD